MAKKVFTKIDDIISALGNGNSLAVTVDNTTIIAGFQVLNQLTYRYSEWSFLQHPLSNSLTAFMAQYTAYTADMGNNFLRMYQALIADYNPIENYSMTEDSIDGSVISEKTKKDVTDNLHGSKQSDSTTTQGGTENHSIGAHTDTTDHYTNAFDSGISDTGTHSSRDSTSVGAHSDTITFTNRTTEAAYDNDASGTSTADGDSTSLSGMSAIGQAHDVTESTEGYANDIDLGDMGDGYSTADIHKLTRSGNIGVTTSQQMIESELKLRLANLTDMWVDGFIKKYCVFLGVEE